MSFHFGLPVGPRTVKYVLVIYVIRYARSDLARPPLRREATVVTHVSVPRINKRSILRRTTTPVVAVGSSNYIYITCIIWLSSKRAVCLLRGVLVGSVVCAFAVFDGACVRSLLAPRSTLKHYTFASGLPDRARWRLHAAMLSF